MPSAIGYTRVSTDEQGASGLGLEAQKAAIRGTAARLGLEVSEVHTDSGISGAASVERRPGLLAALGGLGRGDVLLVAKRDRLGRDPIVVAMAERMAERRGARIVSAAGEGTEGDDPTSILMRRVVDAFAEYERLLIGARTKAALRAKRTRGLKTGGDVPFGFRVEAGGRLVAEAGEQDTVRLILALRADGRSLSAVAEELNGRGLATKQGAPWSHKQVARILARTEAGPVAAGSEAAREPAEAA